IIKKMIDLRNILKALGQDNMITLPSIVVVGSQSSGKSSVLESIVGHEFLPKGSNMVTRRPLELTLVNCETEEDYAEFPNLGLGKIYDFKKVQKTLTDLNNAVPEKECISNSPIELYVYSKNVPDLSLVDLPGYIQITSKDQPEKLREKIIDLCDNYIKDKNIILAVSAADVDLANSEALKRSRAADPLGTRTIGVITKMDLVDPQSGYQILNNKSYPLPMGYIGVVCKPGTSASFETNYFKQNKVYADDSSVSVSSLRKKLIKTLEASMKDSLSSVNEAVLSELSDVKYQFKVLFNDREISPEGYVSTILAQFKSNLTSVASQFSKSSIRKMIRDRLERSLIEIIAQNYWFNPSIKALDKESASDPYWIRQVQIGSSSLAKSGIGKNCTIDLVNEMESQFSSLVNKEPFVHHSSTLSQMVQLVQKKLRNKL
ncbi:hypothetical protein ROZALSC1DRAFT_8376, partial [Rozella allomycis CSF55]